jgi:hypothetical protein
MRRPCVVSDGAREHGSEHRISAHLDVERVHHDCDVVLGQCRKKLFLQFWGVPLSDERHRRAGIYHARTFGPEGEGVLDPEL